MKMVMMMVVITLGMPIQLPDPSDATEQGESGTPELFRSGVLEIAISVMIMMMMTMLTMMATMMAMLISLVIIRRVGKTGSDQPGPSVAPTRVLRVKLGDKPAIRIKLKRGYYTVDITSPKDIGHMDNSLSPKQEEAEVLGNQRCFELVPSGTNALY